MFASLSAWQTSPRTSTCGRCYSYYRRSTARIPQPVDRTLPHICGVPHGLPGAGARLEADDSCGNSGTSTCDGLCPVPYCLQQPHHIKGVSILRPYQLHLCARGSDGRSVDFGYVQRGTSQVRVQVYTWLFISTVYLVCNVWANLSYSVCCGPSNTPFAHEDE